jgi:hypothetical protein
MLKCNFAESQVKVLFCCNLSMHSDCSNCIYPGVSKVTTMFTLPPCLLVVTFRDTQTMLNIFDSMPPVIDFQVCFSSANTGGALLIPIVIYQLKSNI